MRAGARLLRNSMLGKAHRGLTLELPAIQGQGRFFDGHHWKELLDEYGGLSTGQMRFGTVEFTHHKPASVLIGANACIGDCESSTC